MNHQQNFNARNDFVQIIDKSNLRVGKNILVNRLCVLNGEIHYDWLNGSLISFKIKCKAKFLMT